MSVGDEIILSGYNINHQFSQNMEPVDVRPSQENNTTRNLFGKETHAVMVEHSYEPKFEDESDDEVGQEETLTEDQISMIQSNKTLP